MTDSQDPRPELGQFLRDRAASMEHDAASIGADDVKERVVTRSLEPRRWVRTPAAVAHGARRQPAVAAAVVAALLIGSLGGFAVGHGTASRSGQVAVARGATDGTTTTTAVPPEFSTATGVQQGPLGPPTMTRLFVRTTGDGVAIRAYLVQYDQGFVDQSSTCGSGSWCPPPECSSPIQINGELSNDLAVGQIGAGPLPLHGHAELRSALFFGEAEGTPANGWIVQVDGTVTNVRATWPDGSVDEMTPTHGWAMVAHSGTDVASQVDAISNDGSTTTLTQVAPYPSECTPPPPPPPALPEPGNEQPGDVQAAKDAVKQVYETVYTHGFQSTGDGTYVEDGANLAKLGAQVKSNYPEATDTITVEVGDIVFLSKTDAALYFELKYNGGAMFGKQIGYAKFIDGSWKVARDTMCMVFSWGGVQCDPPPDPARSTGYGTAPPTRPDSPPATSTPN